MRPCQQRDGAARTEAIEIPDFCMLANLRRGLRGALVSALRRGFNVSGGRTRRLFSDALKGDDETLPLTTETIATPRGPLTFYCLGALPLWRAKTLFTKEPETIEWIDSFAEGDVFWDIGANIGIYSLYAAAHRNIRVLAFEPAAGNYFLLNRNIELNSLDSRLRAYCVAFSNAKGAEALYMQSTELGGSQSNFGTPVDGFGQQFAPSLQQGTIGYSIDSFIAEFDPPFPNYIKIDVDGIEDRIILGASKTLRDLRLKSLSVELDSARERETDAVIASIEQAGLKLISRRNSEMVANSAYRTIFNYQFRR